MLIIQISILVILATVFVQDLLSRSVYWILFPLLGILYFSLRLSNQSVMSIFQSGAINIGFLAIQLLCVSAYFIIKSRRLINITNQLLGWGDILFLISTAVYLSVFNFLFFYIASLICILFFWLNWQLLVNIKNKYIPLAGLQAIILFIALIADWWFVHIDLTSDYWLLKFVAK